MHVVIRADGGPDIGYGHLVRTSALAEELLRRDHQVTYATTASDQVAEVCPPDIEAVRLPSRTDVSSLLDHLNQTDADAALLDSYLADENYQRAVRDSVPLAVVSDDTRHPICADVLVNGNLYAPDLDYETLGNEPIWCLGPDYLLLRRAIAQFAVRDPPWREEPTRALVTMGGSDTKNFTPTILRAFDGFDLRVDAIVGPGFSDELEQGVRTTAKNLSTDVQVSRDPDDLPERMFQADIGVCTASSSTYELLTLGTPFVGVIQADNQRPIAEALTARKLAVSVGRDPTIDDIETAVETLCTDRERRRGFQRRGRALIDGKGRYRVADVVERLTR